MSDTQTIDAPANEVEVPTGDPTPEPAADQARKPRRLPTYGLEKVETLPEDVPTSRADLYFNLLEQIKAQGEADAGNVGEWYCIATFQTPTGANAVAKDLKDGKRNIPKGEWEFQARKIANPNEPLGAKWSKLFARYMGNG